ncbi:hypothetical protein [Alteromonas halophila]|uniref:Uncharacterized protein n=1 Tax=Alteromonas halophila TaxID=516698 RepID=A0A918JCJ1_9ALTE|nr:hypothetical protein [Alteromonas halophila]GGW73592.1 hypothetical protein GCM10007391_01600 [Alteromonas halophila]
MQHRRLHVKLPSHFTVAGKCAELGMQATLSPSLHAVNPSIGAPLPLPWAEGIEMQQRPLYFKFLSHFTGVGEYALLRLQATLSSSLHAVTPSLILDGVLFIIRG